ncbi:MAG: MBOAT family O-acyltransferase [Bacilli bacterium]
MSKRNSKALFIVLLSFNIGLLLVFKYCNFFFENINNIFNLNLNYLKITLPIGISFYTFQALTYVIDVYNKKVSVQNSIIKLGCYISAFPQLIAGPIVRYSTVNEELENRKENIADFSAGIRRFIVGLAKKAIIANELAYVADSLLGYSLPTIGFIGVFLGAIAYTLQIYYDFSGYSDMAIGLGRMLGFHYLENFNFPYISKSITDFWRRWHISLSSFFRDYVYIPLGGNRCSKFKNIINILIVWTLTGLWHGSSWNFVLWGLYYGILLIVEKFILKNVLEKTPNFIKHIYTLLLVVIAWIIFYYTDLRSLGEALKSLIGLNGFGNINAIIHLQVFKVRTIIIFVLALLFSVPVKVLKKDSIIKDIILIIIFLLSVIFIVASSYNPFIYFRF